MDDALIAEASQALEEAISAVVLNPVIKFMAYHTLQRVHRITTNPKCDTAWTDGYTCEYNPAYFLAQSAGKTGARVGLVLHETGHSANMHFIRQCGRDKDTWNIAGDEEINLPIRAAGIELPPGGYCTAKYKDWPAEHIYDDLIQQKKDKPDPGQGSGKAPGQGIGGDMVEPGSLTEKAPTGDIKALEQHVVALNRKAIITAQMNGYGNQVPSGIAGLVKKLSQPMIPWTNILKRYASYLTRGKLSYRRFNRRYLHQEHFLPDRKSEHLAEIFIGQDTSGSVSKAEHEADLTEMIEIMRCGKPKKVHYAQWGSAVVFEKTIKPGEKIEGLEMHRGGGTRPISVLRLIAQKNPKLAIIMTDGDFAKEGLPEPNCPVIWVIYDDPNWKPPFGQVIHYTRRKRT